jgi:hypothetical protein
MDYSPQTISPCPGTPGRAGNLPARAEMGRWPPHGRYLCSARKLSPSRTAPFPLRRTPDTSVESPQAHHGKTKHRGNAFHKKESGRKKLALGQFAQHQAGHCQQLHVAAVIGAPIELHSTSNRPSREACNHRVPTTACPSNSVAVSGSENRQLVRYENRGSRLSQLELAARLAKIARDFSQPEPSQTEHTAKGPFRITNGSGQGPPSPWQHGQTRSGTRTSR